MRKHPDADTFVLAHLRQPAEATTRLVFADWLDETGTPANVAWAEYIRLREATEREGSGSSRHGDLLRRLADSAGRVKAKLTVSARALVSRFETLPLLLPLTNVTVRLAGYAVPPAALDLMPESVAVENLLLPLAARGDTLLLACPDPRELDLQRRLEFILNRRITLVRAAPDDLRAALDAAFGPEDWVYADTTLTEFAVPVLEATAVPGANDPIARLVNLLVMEAVNAAMAPDHALRPTRVRLRPEPDGLVVCDAIETDWVERTRLPERLARPVLTRLAIMAGLDVGLVYAPPVTVHPLYGRFNFSMQSARFAVEVTAHPSPDGPTLDLDIREGI